MTITTETNKANHVADGIETVFSYNFRVDDATHMHVYIDSVEQLTGWTVDGIGDQGGGNVTFTVPPDDTLVVTLLRMVPVDQLIDLTAYGAFPSETVEQEGFDKSRMIDQQLSESIGRALQAPISDQGGFDYSLPSPIADHAYLVNSTGDGLIMSEYPLDETVNLTNANKIACETAETNAETAETNAEAAATDSQLKAWEAEAEALTADSYATEPEDTFVNVYTSDGDGTFTATPTTEYSALHWAAKAAGSARFGTNILINGNPLVNQRGVTGTVVLLAGEYGLDRWRAGSSGCTFTFATVENVTTITIASGTLEQEIEGSNIQSGSYVLSWVGSSQGQIDGGGFGDSGVIAALVGGTNSIVEFSTGTLSLVQLEKGNVATDFEHRLTTDELILCQRYYEIGRAKPCQFYANATGSWRPLHENFQVAKRANPSVVVTASGLSGISSVVAESPRVNGFAYLATVSVAGKCTANLGEYTANAEL